MQKNNNYFCVNLLFDLFESVHVQVITSTKRKAKQKLILCNSLDDASLLMFDLERAKQKLGFKYCSDNNVFSLVPQNISEIVLKDFS